MRRRRGRADGVRRLTAKLLPEAGRDMKKKIDPTLFELCLGIVLYGIVFQLVLLLAARKISYSVGLWIGVALAVAGAVHMWWSLNRGLDLAAKGDGGSQQPDQVFCAGGDHDRAGLYGFCQSDLCILRLYGDEGVGLLEPADA